AAKPHVEPAEHLSQGAEPAKLAYDETEIGPELPAPIAQNEAAGDADGDSDAREDEYGFPLAGATEPVDTSADTAANAPSYEHAAEDDVPADDAPEIASRSTADPALARSTDPAVTHAASHSVVAHRAASANATRAKNYVASTATRATGRRGGRSYWSAARETALYDGAVYSLGEVVDLAPTATPTSPMFGGQYAFSPRAAFGEAIGEPVESATMAWPNPQASSKYIATTTSDAVQYELSAMNYGATPVASAAYGGCETCSLGTGCLECDPCEDCCLCETGYWEIGVEAQLLHRSPANSRGPLVTCNCLFQHELSFNASDAEQKWGAGYRFSARRVNYCGPDFELIYSNNQDWVYNNWFTGNLIVLGTNIGTGSARARYLSELRSGEANVLLPWNNWTNVLLGFRWFELDEHASILANGNMAAFNTSVDTLNELVGGQIGLERTLIDDGDALTIHTTLKTGIYANRITRTTKGFMGDPAASANEVSFAGELDVTAKYQFNPHLVFTAGYDLLWIETTALAIEQYPDPTDAIDTTGSPFYHGFLMGLEVVW
ncbi:MAG: BBP7 family outer membrane beta-barrel protein, partial [Planctomycetales bacterium]|nr:BBP7 family outer membrane beta-barrel protein [Planctomycetales bacterium]